MRTPRDYKSEYRQRMLRGLKAGLTKSQSRGHSTKIELPGSISRLAHNKRDYIVTAINMLSVEVGGARRGDREFYLKVKDLVSAYKSVHWKKEDKRPPNERREVINIIDMIRDARNSYDTDFAEPGETP